MFALSVSISTSSSPTATSSPTCFSQVRIVPSSIESERRGITTSLMGQLHAYRLPLRSAGPSPLHRQGAADERRRRSPQDVAADRGHPLRASRLQPPHGGDRLDFGARFPRRGFGRRRRPRLLVGEAAL